MPGRSKLARLLSVAVLLCCYGMFGLGSAHATALPMGSCTTTSGVVVAVDFGHWSGPVIRACGSTPTTGYQLVNQGGFSTTGTVHDGPGFVCRIRYSGFRGGTSYPTQAEVGCGSTPPATSSWSYWNANPGQSSWTLSPSGAASTSPVAGAVQAWTFGGGYPSFSPGTVRPHNGSPSSSAPVSTPAPGRSASASKPAPRPSGTVAAGTARTGNRTATGPASQPSGRAGISSATTSAAGSASSAAVLASSNQSAGPSASPTILDAQPVAATRGTGSGSYLPELTGGAVVLALAALAGLAAWQRKRTG